MFVLNFNLFIRPSPHFCLITLTILYLLIKNTVHLFKQYFYLTFLEEYIGK